ncbi:MAG TPA: SDR family NAD(P)-dependent oxidoreductase [Beijerinckiaceae bacterium]|jgi:short-subunit dehydrogenase|nr:SDR family NAD(P)-dependent oxidoreductase [Beijerinckiaceae bacterium]
MRRDPRSILITGASSGIGRAVARAYAEPGRRLTLIGRHAERLAAVAAECTVKGAATETVLLDVRDREAAWRTLRELDAREPFDLVLANAGIATGLKPGQFAENPDAVRGTIATNLFGVLNTVEPLIDPMCARGRGQIAIVSSIAAIRGLPYSPAYCASKAAVHLYADSLRGNLEPRGVTVSLICPGFVHTPMNEKLIAAKPLAISDEKAARIIRRGLDRGRALIAFPRLLYLGARFISFLPARLVDRVMNRMHVDMQETPERMPGGVLP